eukprot:2077262-Rhodomonas_salina.3
MGVVKRLADCVAVRGCSCPQYATTARTAETRADACVCVASTYIVTDSVSGLSHCMTCPVGAQCAASGACALRSPSQACEQDNTTSPSSIVGDWTREAPGREFRVRTCPAGYSRITSLDGTSSGVFFHDSQQCRKCEPGRHYILNPDTDTCQRCPPGVF